MFIPKKLNCFWQIENSSDYVVVLPVLGGKVKGAQMAQRANSFTHGKLRILFREIII
jgi:hypothetical protein